MKRRRMLTALGAMLAAAIGLAGLQATTGAAKPGPAAAGPNCQLANGVKHVVYLQFDNTHYSRDNPSIASDLQQMPHLLNFLQ